MLRNARGEGSFTKNANGTVTHRKGVGYKADGGRKTLTVTASSRAALYSRDEEERGRVGTAERTGEDRR